MAPERDVARAASLCLIGREFRPRQYPNDGGPNRVVSDLPRVPSEWGGWDSNHDRRIMSPARQQPSSGWLAWADTVWRHAAQTDFGTYWA